MTTNGELMQDRANVRVLLLERIHPGAGRLLAQQGFTNVEQVDSALEHGDLLDAVRDVHVLGIRSRTKLTAEIFAEARSLMAVGCFCIGTNQVALEAAASRGVPVFNAPHSSTRSVAEMVIGLTVMLTRGTFAKSMAAHRGAWHKSAEGAHEVRGKVLGIVGYGHIGSQVSILAEALGMRVVFHDIQTKLPLGNALARDSLEQVLSEADVVTLHVPEDESTRGMMSAAALARMKRGAFLINASRGTVVDIDALAAALDSGALAGAAVDVFPVEPKGAEQRLENPLVGRRDVILTPHVGGSTVEAQENIGTEVATKLARFCGQACTEGAVNFPMVNLPAKPETRRLLHVHRNIPGVLRQINEAVADSDINVLGQYLATDSQIGAVVLDVEKGAGFSAPLLDLLTRIEGTIRARVVY